MLRLFHGFRSFPKYEWYRTFCQKANSMDAEMSGVSPVATRLGVSHISLVFLSILLDMYQKYSMASNHALRSVPFLSIRTLALFLMSSMEYSAGFPMGKKVL